LPISAVDTISPAFQHTKRQLLQPFRLGQWVRLALVGLLAGELASGGGCNFNVPISRPSSGDRLLPLGGLASDPALYFGLIALLVVLGLIFAVLLIYVNSVMRFVLFDSIVARECHVRQGWNRRQGAGFRYFLWQLSLLGVTVAAMTILIGIPLGIGFSLGWLKAPGEHVAPLVLGGILLFFLFFAFVIGLMLVTVLTKDFVVPQMALEEIGAVEGWRRLLPMLKTEMGGYAGYIGMKIVMTLAAAVIVGVVSAIVFLIILIPVGGFGVIAVIGGKAAGLTWNAYTITLAIVVGSIVVGLLLYVLSLISVPVIVFFPAYSIYFFAARYRALAQALYPLPPAASALTPPEPQPSG
jgi:hypothetical protein